MGLAATIGMRGSLNNKAEFLKFLAENGYFNVRELPDGTFAGLYKLLFTTAICTGLDEMGYAYRWCFDDPVLALTELTRIETMDEQPIGFIARRYGFTPASTSPHTQPTSPAARS